MAGPRRAQYVSIPLGPGVLSNTTGRGARTRLNYMNWDRWKDATWVRWHKLLPEKQGGWQYQALLGQATYQTLVPGAPTLLLHLNAVTTSFAVTLLLHMDGVNGSTSFPDSGPLNLPVTANGTATVTTTGPKFGTGALLIGTATDNITTPCPAAGPLDLSTGDFTVEFWFYPTVLSINLEIFEIGSGSGYLNGGFMLFLPSATTVNLQAVMTDTVIVGAALTSPLNVNAWNHIALCRKDNLFFLFVNGVGGSVGFADPNPITWAGGSLKVGAGLYTGSSVGNKYDELRVIAGLALYTADFTPAGPLTSPVVFDAPNYSDSSGYRWPMTANATADVETTNPKFGNGAFAADGATAVVETPIGVGTPLDLTETDFTVELWMYATANTVGLLVDASNGHTAGFFVEHLGSAAVQASVWNGSSYQTINGATALNTWTALALVRAGAVFTLYVNGVAAGTTTYSGTLGPAGGNLGIGGGFTTSLAGDIDEVRVTPVALYTTNYTPAVAENTLGVPNTTGSAIPPTGFIPSTYQGVARDLHDWASIDGQYWIAVGTHVKLYVVNQSTLYDVTPTRKTSNVVNALTTTVASAVVTVVDAGHQAATGDFVDITGASPVGGLSVFGSYAITVVDPNTYTVLAAKTAVSAATGGGDFSIAYEIGAGLPANGELLGYGTGLYGALTYGTPRLAGQGVFARMRTWSLDNYGQDLVASQSDGEIYIWQRNSGPNSRAILVPNAPQGVQRVIVDAQQRVIIALGCTDVTSAFDAMLVRWCSFDDITDWVPTDVNTAGDNILVAGSRIITGLKTKGQNLIFTDTTLYRMVFVGSPDIYDFIPAGTVTIVGPNACVDVDGVGYLMGFDNFYNYSGTLNLQACDVWETVFDPTVTTSLNRTQSEAVVCFTYEPKTEITWLYPSIGGALAVTFSAGIAQYSTSATLAAPWALATGFYTLEFDDQEAQPVFLTAAATTATWSQALLGAVGAVATVIGCDRYVTFNWEDGTWYCGAWKRTAAQGRAPAMQGYPYGVDAGYLYRHEVGTDAVEAWGTQALGFFMQSLDITTGGAKSEYTMGGSDARFAIGGSDSHLLLRSMLPDWKYFTGEMNLTIFTKDRPQEQTYVQSGPVEFDDATTQIDIDANGSQLVIQLDNYTEAGGAPSLGCSFRMGIFQGLAIPYVKR